MYEKEVKKMVKQIKYDYNPELDILHVYSKDIENGIKGCLSMGNFNIDVGNNNKIVGIEIEETSKVLRLNPDVLSSPDQVELIVRKSGNMLFMGVRVIKGKINSFIQIPTPLRKIPLQMDS